MGGGCTGAPAEGGKESDEGLGGPKVEELDAASRRLPSLPAGLMAKVSHAASAGLNGVPAPPCAHFLAWKPFAINAAPIDCPDTLLGTEDLSVSHNSGIRSRAKSARHAGRLGGENKQVR